MTERQIKKLEAYFVDLANRMGLGEWEVGLTASPLDEDRYAECHVFANQQRANITISDQWLTWTPHFLRATLAHELVHCYLDSLERAQNHLEELVGKPAFHVYTLMVHDQHEQAVDAIATAWANSLPLPPKF